MRTIPAVLTVFMFGCGLDAVDAPPEPPPEFTPYDTRCRSLECGNSSEVGRNGLHEASLSGKWDDNKIYLETNEKGRAQIWNAERKPFDLHVERSTISGVNAWGEVIRRDQLIGAEIHVWQSGWPLYNIRIGAWRPFTTRIGTVIEVYEMYWQPLDGSPEGELCNVPAFPRGEEDLGGMTRFETLVFPGDRINAHAKTMSKDDEWDPDWFNFGCAGRTLAKLKINGQTTEDRLPDRDPARPQGWARRQATLKMLVADYCGGGTAYTEHGVPLVWGDGQGMQYRATPVEIEGRWDEKGATCLNRPRLAVHPVPGVDVAAEMMADMCFPRICYEPPPLPPSPGPEDFRDGAQVVSAYF